MQHLSDHQMQAITCKVYNTFYEIIFNIQQVCSVKYKASLTNETFFLSEGHKQERWQMKDVSVTEKKINSASRGSIQNMRSL